MILSKLRSVAFWAAGLMLAVSAYGGQGDMDGMDMGKGASVDKGKAVSATTKANNKTRTKKMVKNRKRNIVMTYWTCAMHGGDFAKPGKCPLCGMELVKMKNAVRSEGRPVGGAVSGTAAAMKALKTGKKDQRYTCPMDGGDFDKPGKCPKCKMNLVEKG